MDLGQSNNATVGAQLFQGLLRLTDVVIAVVHHREQNLDDLAQAQGRMLRWCQQGSAACDLGGLNFEIRAHVEVQLVDELTGKLPG